MVFNAMKSVIAKKANENTLVRGKSVNLKPQLGTAIACLLHDKASKKTSFMQSMFSIQFWRGGLKRNSIKQFVRTGICKGYNATLKFVDKIRLDFDSAAIKCKVQIQEQLGNVKTDMLLMTPNGMMYPLPLQPLYPTLKMKLMFNQVTTTAFFLCSIWTIQSHME